MRRHQCRRTDAAGSRYTDTVCLPNKLAIFQIYTWSTTAWRRSRSRREFSALRAWNRTWRALHCQSLRHKLKKCDLSLRLKECKLSAWQTAAGKLFHTTGPSTNRVVGPGRRAEPIACRIIVAVGVYRIGQVVKTHTGNSGNMPYLSPILPAGTEFCKILQKDRNSMETGKFCGSAYNSACRRNLWSPFIKYLAIECKYKYHYPHVR